MPKTVPKGSRQLHVVLDAGLLARLHTWQQAQQFPPTLRAIVTSALTAFLDKHEPRKGRT